MNVVHRFYRMLERPLPSASRIVLALLVIPLGFVFALPLWTIFMVAPQYPDGLELEIYAHTVEGEIQEINTLNHYIGMAPINRTELSDLDWIPFAIGALVLLTLRVAAIGKGRDLVDLFVLFAYFSVFSMIRFVYKLWVYGHNLDPRAPFEVEPFTPAILGTKQIANFTTTSLPAGGSVLMAVFGLGLLALVVWLLATTRRVQTTATAPAPQPA